MSDDKIIIHDLYVRDPPGWFRRIGNGPWEAVDLSPFGGRLPVVWLKPEVSYVVEETWKSMSSVSAEGAGQKGTEGKK